MQVSNNIATQLGSLGDSYTSGVQAGQQQRINESGLALQQVQIDAAKNQQKYDKVAQTLKLLEPGAVNAAKNGGQKGIDDYTTKVLQNPEVVGMFKGLGIDPNNIRFQVADGEIKSTNMTSQKIFDKPTVMDINGIKVTKEPGAYNVTTEIRNGVPKITSVIQDTEYAKKQQDLQKGKAEISEIGARTNYYNAEASAKKNPPVKKLPAAAVPKLSDMAQGVKDLNKVAEFLNDPHIQEVTGPVMGMTRGLNPYDAKAVRFRKFLDSTRQILGKAMEGGKLSDKDEKKYEKILSTIRTDPESILNNMNDIRKILTDKYNSELQAYGDTGYDVSKIKPLEDTPIVLANTKSSVEPVTVPQTGGVIVPVSHNSYNYTRKK